MESVISTQLVAVESGDELLVYCVGMSPLDLGIDPDQVIVTSKVQRQATFDGIGKKHALSLPGKKGDGEGLVLLIHRL